MLYLVYQKKRMYQNNFSVSLLSAIYSFSYGESAAERLRSIPDM